MSLPTRPGVAVEASQQVLIEALPPILILHIKRFHFDTEFSGVVKVGKQVRFGPELEIGPGRQAIIVHIFLPLTFLHRTYVTYCSEKPVCTVWIVRW